MADVKQPIEAVPVRPRPKKNIGFTVRTITPAVFLTGEYSVRPEAKAAELTKLVQGLLAYGIYPSVKDAAANGVPAGTFIIVDDPKTPEKEFSVQIVPRIGGRRLIPRDPGDIIKEA